MHSRALSYTSIVAAALLGAGASGASAAHLYTNTAHTTMVAVGATASATATEPGIRLTSGSATVNNCTGSTLSLEVNHNTSPNVTLVVTAGSFSNCIQPTTFTGEWALHITGSAFPYSGTVTNVLFDFLNGSYSGNITTGISVSKSGTGPLCVNLSSAGTVSGPLTSVGKIDGQYCLEGTAAAWDLTN
jgi:hypothetical protein